MISRLAIWAAMALPLTLTMDEACWGQLSLPWGFSRAEASTMSDAPGGCLWAGYRRVEPCERFHATKPGLRCHCTSGGQPCSAPSCDQGHGNGCATCAASCSAPTADFRYLAPEGKPAQVPRQQTVLQQELDSGTTEASIETSVPTEKGPKPPVPSPTHDPEPSLSPQPPLSKPKLQIPPNGLPEIQVPKNELPTTGTSQVKTNLVATPLLLQPALLFQKTVPQSGQDRKPKRVAMFPESGRRTMKQWMQQSGQNRKER